MAPGKTKKRHGYGSKKKKLKYKAGLDLKKRTKDVDQIHVRAEIELGKYLLFTHS